MVRSAVEGLPVSIKDLFDVKGETTMAGSVAREGEPAAEHNAVVVDRLIAAGAVIVGRTNMTEFAYWPGHQSALRYAAQSWDRATGRIPGGSSSGAAVSVADGGRRRHWLDTGGSVRIPAALCGLTGFKPSAWRVSIAGVLPLSPTWIPSAPSPPACAAAPSWTPSCRVTTSERLRCLPLRGLRLAVPVTLALDATDKHVADTCAHIGPAGRGRRADRRDRGAGIRGTGRHQF